MWSLLVKPISDVIGKIVDKVAPDAGMAEKLKFRITQELISADFSVIEQQVKVITAEAQGSWMQRNWRPLVMLNFAALVTAHWLGFTPANLPEAQVLALLDIVQVGLAGYVVGRSAEKIMREYKS
jgi:polyphosphate kinase